MSRLTFKDLSKGKILTNKFRSGRNYTILDVDSKSATIKNLQTGNTMVIYSLNNYELKESISIISENLESAVRNLVRETFRNEIISEAPTKRSEDFFEDSKYGIAIHKLLKGKWDSKKVETFLDKLGEGNDVKHARILDFIAGSLRMNIRKYKTLGELMPELVKTIEHLYKTHNESINEEEEQLDEKLITFSNRAPYGQIVFIAGGAGSGKGFAVSNFLDSSGFKVRDVDEMKKQIQKLNAIGKISIDQIIQRFGRNIAPKDMDIIKKIQADGFELKTMNLKNPDHVYALHILVDAMGIKDKTLENMLAAKSNPETLPNIIFDITAKKVTSITEVLPMLESVGYKAQNIHLIWVLTDYNIAIKQNAERERVVPADIMLQTHVGAGNTIWGLVTSALPKGMNGRVDVILNNQENTIFYIQRTTDKKTGKKKPVVSGFLSLPVKKQGGGILPEKVWRDILYKWIKDNGPEELTSNM
jgi:dephospho-CoA kinase